MNAVPESTIPLTESETEFLKRALREAKEQATQSVPEEEDGTSPASKSEDTEINPKPGHDSSSHTTTFIL